MWLLLMTMSACLRVTVHVILAFNAANVDQ